MKSSRVVALVVFTLLLSALPLSAQRKRPVRPVAPERATLRIVVVNADTSSPIVGAHVLVGTTQYETDDKGVVTAANLNAGSVVSVNVKVVGYETETKSVTLAAGTNNLEVRIRPSRPAVVTMKNGTTYQIDVNSTEFGYVVAFLGYTKGPFLNVCRGAEQLTVQRSEIAVITGPAVSGTNACCGPVAQTIKLQLKNAQTFDAVMRDSCEGYTMDIATFDLATRKALFLPLKDVARVEFP